MKPTNEELQKDIIRLKTLHAKKDKSEFSILKQELMHKHKISKATIYREMKKDIPGEYKIPNYSAAVYNITEREIMMVRELLLNGRQHNEIVKIMSRELEIPYNWDRFNKARELSEQPGICEHIPCKTEFAKNGRFFLEKLFDLEYMAPGAYAEIEIDGHILKVTRETFDIINLYLMKDNPPANADEYYMPMIDEVLNDDLMFQTVSKNIAKLLKHPEMSSPYAIKSLMDVKDKLSRRRYLKAEKKKFLLYKSKLPHAKSFYEQEATDSPTPYDPERISNSQAAKILLERIKNGESYYAPVDENLLFGRKPKEANRSGEEKQPTDEMQPVKQDLTSKQNLTGE
jgi:hypothetical protein